MSGREGGREVEREREIRRREGKERAERDKRELYVSSDDEHA